MMHARAIQAIGATHLATGGRVNALRLVCPKPKCNYLPNVTNYRESFPTIQLGLSNAFNGVGDYHE